MIDTTKQALRLSKMIAWMKAAFIVDTRATEFFSICFKFWWAYILAASSRVFESSPGYAMFSHVADERQWSMAFFALAIIHSGSMIFGWYRLRRISCFFCSLMWLFVALLILISNPLSTGTGMYAIVALASFWVFWAGPSDKPITYIDSNDKGEFTTKVV